MKNSRGESLQTYLCGSRPSTAHCKRSARAALLCLRVLPLIGRPRDSLQRKHRLSGIPSFGCATPYAEVTGCALPGTLVAVLPWITPLKSARAKRSGGGVERRPLLHADSSAHHARALPPRAKTARWQDWALGTDIRGTALHERTEKQIPRPADPNRTAVRLGPQNHPKDVDLSLGTPTRRAGSRDDTAVVMV